MSRSVVESVIREIGGPVVDASEDQIHFEGGHVPFLPDVVLKSCTVFDAGDSVGCAAEISPTTHVLPALFAAVVAIVGFFAGGSSVLIGVLVVAAIVGVGIMVQGQIYAQQWLLHRIEAQQGAPGDDPRPARSAGAVNAGVSSHD